jgi:hypothetical protein
MGAPTQGRSETASPTVVELCGGRTEPGTRFPPYLPPSSVHINTIFWNRYEGKWKEGQAHGRGTMVHARGDRYDGECKDGKFHGEGTYTWAVGNTYKGEWRNDKGHGQGVYIWADVRIQAFPHTLHRPP